jgi:general secretion pathway protein C
VAFDHVILERGGARESLFMDQSGGGEGDVTPVADMSTEAPADIAAPLRVGGAAGE